MFSINKKTPLILRVSRQNKKFLETEYPCLAYVRQINRQAGSRQCHSGISPISYPIELSTSFGLSGTKTEFCIFPHPELPKMAVLTSPKERQTGNPEANLEEFFRLNSRSLKKGFIGLLIYIGLQFWSYFVGLTYL